MSRGGSVGIVAALLGVVAVWQSLGVVHDALAVARSGAHASRTDRLLLPAQVVGVSDPSVFIRLERLIPAKATYGIQAERDSPPEVYAGGEGPAFAYYWLLPRRLVPITAPQDYTIFFGSVPAGSHTIESYPVATGVTLLRDR